MSWKIIKHSNRNYGIWDTMGCELFLNLPKNRAMDVCRYFNEFDLDGRRMIENDIYIAVGTALFRYFSESKKS